MREGEDEVSGGDRGEEDGVVGDRGGSNDKLSGGAAITTGISIPSQNVAWLIMMPPPFACLIRSRLHATLAASINPEIGSACKRLIGSG